MRRAIVEAVRVLLVDHNKDFVSKASDWLVSDSGIDLVGTAATGKEAIEAVGRLVPDVVVFDESLPDMRIVDVMRRIQSSETAPRIVLLTLHEGETVRQVKAVTGADEVLTRSRVTQRLLPVIHELPRTKRSTNGTRPTESTRSEP